MNYEDIFKELNKAKIRYLVAGGVAVNLYGFARMTMDLDLFISLDTQNRTAFYRLMKGLGFKTKKPKLARDLMLGKQVPGKVRVVSFFRQEFELIDVFIQPLVDFDKAYKKRKIFKAGKIRIPTVPYETLISMKRETGRERDLLDIGYLERIKRLKK